MRASCVPFCLSFSALLDAEAMLLVDDDEREPLELDALLEQRVRADDDGGAAVGDSRERRGSRARRSARRAASRLRNPKGRASARSSRRAARRAAPSAPSRPSGYRPRPRRARPSRRRRSCPSRRRLAATGSSACLCAGPRRSRRTPRLARESAGTAARRETPRAARAAPATAQRSLRIASAEAPQRQPLRDELLERDAARARDGGPSRAAPSPRRAAAMQTARAPPTSDASATARRRACACFGLRRGEQIGEVVLERFGARAPRARRPTMPAQRLLVQAFGARIDRRQASLGAARRRVSARGARGGPSRDPSGPRELRRSSARACRARALARRTR